ncbi:MAG TPA: alpha/beta fold hydrolase [Chitinispirillaceae bacterium]|nr:alpha/beta fold hydrolase [Chitinispirillaceae bacterium]
MKLLFILSIQTIFLFLFPGCYIIKKTVYDVPGTEVVSPPPMPLSELSIPYSGGSARGWLNKTSPSGDSTPVVLFLHGADQNLQTLLQMRIFAEFAKMKVHIMAIDYPGYGNSSGTPSEKSLIESGDSAFSCLKTHFPSNPKFIAGFTLGAAVAIQVGLKHQADIKGVALISPWISLDSMVAHRYPRWMVSMFLKEKYVNIPAVENLDLPVLVLHGEIDRAVPFLQGKKVADAVPQLKKWQLLKGTSQENIFDNFKFWESLAAFINNPDIDWSQRE